MHNPMLLGGKSEAEKQNEMIAIMKNLALFGAFLNIILRPSSAASKAKKN